MTSWYEPSVRARRRRPLRRLLALLALVWAAWWLGAGLDDDAAAAVDG